MIQATTEKSTTVRVKSQDPSIKVYPDLSLVSLQRKQAKFLRVWYLARFLDERGRGWVWLDDLKRFCLDHSIMSKDSLRQTLRDGDGRWWVLVDYEKRGRKVCLRGIRKICDLLGLEVLRRSPVLLPVNVFCQIADFRAHTYSTVFNGNDKPMSRATIKRISGVSKRSQRNYEQRAGVVVTQNWSRCRLTQRLSEEALGQGEYQRCEKGVWWLYKRLPDTRTSQYKIARRGILRNVNRWLRSGAGYVVSQVRSSCLGIIHPSNSTSRADYCRRYFDRAKQLLKAKNRFDISYLRIGRYKDMMMWEPVYIE